MSGWSYARDLRARVARASEVVDPDRHFTVIERAHDPIERSIGIGIADSDARRIERAIKLLVARRWYAEHGFYQSTAWTVEVADETYETVYPVVWLDKFEAVIDQFLNDGLIGRFGKVQHQIAAE